MQMRKGDFPSYNRPIYNHGQRHYYNPTTSSSPYQGQMVAGELAEKIGFSYCSKEEIEYIKELLSDPTLRHFFEESIVELQEEIPLNMLVDSNDKINKSESRHVKDVIVRKIASSVPIQRIGLDIANCANPDYLNLTARAMCIEPRRFRAFLEKVMGFSAREKLPGEWIKVGSRKCPEDEPILLGFFTEDSNTWTKGRFVNGDFLDDYDEEVYPTHFKQVVGVPDVDI